MALTYFLENCLDFPEQYLRDKDISKIVLVILFPKISQFTCDKIFNLIAKQKQT